MNPARKKEIRQFWVEQALRATDGAELVCVDPDNGIGDDAKMYTAKGPKFVYMDDLRAIWERGQSLVVYHHLGMIKGGAEVMVPAAAAKLVAGLEGAEPIPLWFHGGTARVFFVVPNPESEHKETDKGAG